MIKLKNLFIATIIFGASNICFAAPVYLVCQFIDEEEKTVHKFDLALDESSGLITHTWQDGEVFRVKGFFTENSVIYEYKSMNSVMVTTVQYEINRTNLRINRAISAIATDPEIAKLRDPFLALSNGFCKLQKSVKRKF